MIITTIAGGNLGGSLLRDILGGNVWISSIMGALVGVVVAYVIILLIARLRFPRPFVNLTSGHIRTGNRTASIEDISSAKLLTDQTKKSRALSLVVGVPRGPRAVLLVRSGRERTLTPDNRALIADVLRRSTIVVPTARHDPSGRFSRYNFPDRVSKADAIALIENPPKFRDPLPVIEPLTR